MGKAKAPIAVKASAKVIKSSASAPVVTPPVVAAAATVVTTISAADRKAIHARAVLLASLRKKKTDKTIQEIEKHLINEHLRKLNPPPVKSKAKAKARPPRRRSSTSSEPRKRKPTIEYTVECAADDGNSDDEGSVGSGVLDENICFSCGKSTMDEGEVWENLVLCDVCDCEFHLQCVGLDLPPRHKYTCPRCIDEERELSNLSYDIDPKFPLPKVVKRSKTKGKVEEEKVSVCYSPSRPIEYAFEECQEKGFMLVSRVFPFDVIKKLTHGTVTKVLQSGRVADVWRGATVEFAKQLNNITHSLINRGGRLDLRIPDFVAAELKLSEHLDPILTRLATIMGTPVPRLRTQNIVFVPVGCESQEWHCDDTLTEGSSHRYFTILIHLNCLDAMCGGTEVWVKKWKRGDMIRGRPGDAFVFNGSLWHRGHANQGKTHRLFYYASFACRADANTGDM